MSYRTLLEDLQNLSPEKSFEAFKFLGQLSAFISLSAHDDDVQRARELCIRVLEKSAVFVNYQDVVQGLLRNVGLFPYLKRQEADVGTQVAVEAHRPRAMPESIVFTTKQAEVYRDLMAGRNVVLSAPTSFGKSLIIDAVIASEKHDNIVVVVPTLALVDETRRRLMRFSGQYKVITHLSQEPAQRNIFVHTQERVVENEHIKDIDFFVIDEFYKLQIESGGDNATRSVLLNQAFYRLAKQAKQFYMLGPNIDELPDGFGRNFRCTFIRTDFSTVASETHIVPKGKSDAARLASLVPKLEGPSLVFTGSVRKVREHGKTIAAKRTGFESKLELVDAVDWLAKNFHPRWGVVEALKQGVGVHHGRLPRSVAQLLVRLFNEGYIDYLVCTSTLIEGVNTAARNVVIADDKISQTKYDFFTFNNIRGRSGRMWRHFVGHVYLFYPPPERELEFVDVPAFTQGVDTPESLIVQLDREDLSEISVERLSSIWSQRYLSVETIKQNAGIDPDGQIQLAKYIEENAVELHPLLMWHGYPQYEQLKKTLEMAWTHFGTPTTAGVASGSQLTFKLWEYQKLPGYKAQIDKAVGTAKQGSADSALEGFLEFARQWVSFRAPRMLSAMERIQNEVFSRLRMRPGNYSFYAGTLESLFLSPAIAALDEYGIPLQLAERVVKLLGEPETLDATLEALRTRSSDSFQGLSRFERSLLKPLCRDARGSQSAE